MKKGSSYFELAVFTVVIMRYIISPRSGREERIGHIDEGKGEIPMEITPIEVGNDGREDLLWN